MINQIILNLTIILSLTLLISCSQDKSKNTTRIHNYEVSHDFVQGSEDIPLLLSMKKIKDEGLGFDSPSGSIMSSSYESILKKSEISDFYKKSLPQMGWTLISSNVKMLKFSRDNENLQIDLSSSGHKNIIRFLISYDL